MITKILTIFVFGVIVGIVGALMMYFLYLGLFR